MVISIINYLEIRRAITWNNNLNDSETWPIGEFLIESYYQNCSWISNAQNMVTYLTYPFKVYTLTEVDVIWLLQVK